MKGVVSFDIGMKHLGVSMIWYTKDTKSGKTTVTPCMWDLIDFITDKEGVCESVQKNGKVCGRKAMHETVDGKDVCGRHTTSSTTTKAKKKVNCNKMTVQEIAKRYLELVPKVFDQVIEKMKDTPCATDIVLELQPKVNRKMNMISDWIYINLYERILKSEIDLKKLYMMKASMKLKESGLTYDQRKKKVCNIVSDYLAGKEPYHEVFANICMSDEDKMHMSSSFTGKKRDDLADAFIMALRFIEPKPVSKTKWVRKYKPKRKT